MKTYIISRFNVDIKTRLFCHESFLEMGTNHHFGSSCWFGAFRPHLLQWAPTQRQRWKEAMMESAKHLFGQQNKLAQTNSLCPSLFLSIQTLVYDVCLLIRRKQNVSNVRREVWSLLFQPQSARRKGFGLELQGRFTSTSRTFSFLLPLPPIYLMSLCLSVTRVNAFPVRGVWMLLVMEVLISFTKSWKS